MLEDKRIIELIKEINFLIKGIAAIVILIIICIVILLSDFIFR